MSENHEIPLDEIDRHNLNEAQGWLGLSDFKSCFECLSRIPAEKHNNLQVLSAYYDLQNGIRKSGGPHPDGYLSWSDYFFTLSHHMKRVNNTSEVGPNYFGLALFDTVGESECLEYVEKITPVLESSYYLPFLGMRSACRLGNQEKSLHWLNEGARRAALISPQTVIQFCNGGLAAPDLTPIHTAIKSIKERAKE